MLTDARLTPQDRLREVAAIFAEGFLRLKRRGAPLADPPHSDAPSAPENSQKTLRNSLEPSATSRTHGPPK